MTSMASEAMTPSHPVARDFVGFVERSLHWLDRVDAADTAARQAVRAAGGRIHTCQTVARDDDALELVYLDIDTGDLIGRQVCTVDGQVVSSAVQLRASDRAIESIDAALPVCDVPDPRGFTRVINTYLAEHLYTECASLFERLPLCRAASSVGPSSDRPRPIRG